jgi:hypothetical protein
MPWIKSCSELSDHPKLGKLCALTGWNKAEAIGMLHMLWWTCLVHAEDGNISKFGDSLYLGCTKVDISPLVDSGFIDKTPEGLVIHGWMEYTREYYRSKYHTANPDKFKQRYSLKQPYIGRTKDNPKDIPKDSPDVDKIRVDKIRSTTKSTSTPTYSADKIKILDFVLLKQHEIDKLKTLLNSQYDHYINQLNNYIGSKGKRYKSHYHTILAWYNKNKQEKENEHGERINPTSPTELDKIGD